MKNLVCSLILTAAAWATAADDGFVDLFPNGDMSGWKNVNCAPETWSWKEGVVHCTGKPIGALRTKRQYENFILELEWRHLKSGGNAGVFIWSSPISWPGVPFLRAIEVQVLDNGYGKSDWYTTHGDVFPIHGSTMKPFGRHRGLRSFPSEERSHSSPEWNHYRVVCTNGVLRLSVNGQEVSGGEECVWRKGYLGLESEGSPVEFRNVRLKELPSTGAKLEESAPVDLGWQALYNGVDLRGWKPVGPGKNRWESKDWVLANPGGEGAGQTLWTTESYADCELIWDVKIPPAASKASPATGVRLRGSELPAALIPLSAVGDQAASLSLGKPLPVNKWVRCTLTIKGRNASLRLGEEQVLEAELPDSIPGKGPFGVLDTGSEINFANFYVRPL